jgi:hypothetical protein
MGRGVRPPAGANAAFAKCHNFSCVNKKLNKLNKKVKAVQREIYNCEKVTPVTSYFGYWYGQSGGFTTALDYTEPGDQRDDWMVVYTGPVSKNKLAALPTGIQHKH